MASSITTYVTDAQMSLFYSEWEDHSVDVQAEALTSSYGMVNAFLNPVVQIPYTPPWNGTDQTIEGVPAILKTCQARFAQWIAQSANVGYTDELQELYDSTVEILRGIQAGELGIPGTSISEEQTGWAVTAQSCASGTVHILNPDAYYHSTPWTVELVMDHATSGLLPYHSTFNSSSYASYKYRFPNISTDWQQTGQAADNQWVTIPDASLTISFEGSFNPNETFIIRGIPKNAQNVNEAPRGIVQRPLTRG